MIKIFKAHLDNGDNDQIDGVVAGEKLAHALGFFLLGSEKYLKFIKELGLK